MGLNASSCNLDKTEIDSISKDTGFTHKQIIRLYNRFTALDKSGKGHLDRADFLLIPEVAINPIADRIVHQFFKNSENHNELNFHDFARVLARFRNASYDPQNEYNSREAKLRFLFGMYDLDDDHTITRDELLKMLQMMVGQNISQEQLLNICDRTMAEADINSDGAISFEEFVAAFEGVAVEQKMSIKFLG